MQALKKALKNANCIAVIEKDVAIGGEAGLVTDLKSAFYNSSIRIPIIGFVAGLGGRDITIKDIKKIVARAEASRKGIESDFEFLDLRTEIL